MLFSRQSAFSFRSFSETFRKKMRRAHKKLRHYKENRARAAFCDNSDTADAPESPRDFSSALPA
jgi:hypothetical protein